MNYRHAYHAGGVADVFKHVVLIALLARLKQKERGFFVLDTHAGAGLYDLSGAEAGKTGEFHAGIARVAAAAPSAPLLRGYLDSVAALNPDSGLRFYPGSPWLIARFLRPQDRAAFCELHPEDCRTLKDNLHGMPVHCRDGYEAIGAFVPPKEKRGLVFIDPPFETTDEFAHAARALQDGWLKFPHGIWAFWYPVKERPAIWRFQEDMIAAGIKRQLALEFLTGGEADSRRLSGSGFLLINPPYRIEKELEPVLAELRTILAPDGTVSINWLAME